MNVKITYTNGSDSLHNFPTYSEAAEFWRGGVSYSGDRVRRVELLEGDSARAIWDASWDAISQGVGLHQ